MIAQERITVGRKISWLDYYNGKMCKFRGMITSVSAPLEFGFETEGQEEVLREHVRAILYADDNSVDEMIVLQ